MRLVVALGGNALLRRGEPAEAEIQRARVLESASALSVTAREHALEAHDGVAANAAPFSSGGRRVRGKATTPRIAAWRTMEPRAKR